MRMARTWTLAALLPVATAGCMTMAPPPPPMGPCRIDEGVKMRYAGMRFRERMRAEVEQATNARTSRILRPGDAATMDFRPERLDILLDDMNEISGLRCG